MTTVYVPWTVTGPDGEEVELELAAEVSADGEVIGLRGVSIDKGVERAGDTPVRTVISYASVPKWALAQIDMGDLALDVQRRLKARERGWP